MLWREQRAAPCGATGGLEFTQPRLAAAMAQKRLDGARDIGAEIVLTDDPHCVSHLAQHADGLSVQNLIEVLAEQMAVIQAEEDESENNLSVQHRTSTV